MKHLLSICIYWLCVQYNMAQTLSPVQCFDGGGAERLDKFEPISPTQSLLLLRSTSQNGILQDNTTPDDSLTIRYGQYWLFSLNNSGDTLWKKPLPSSEKTFKRVWISYPFNWETYVNSASSKMYTPLEDEIILHYDHFDSVGYDFPQLNTNNLHISFGIIHTHDGNYKTMPFAIDTLYPDTKPPFISSYQVIKRNDSIYDMAILYGRYVQTYSGYDQTMLIFYRININNQTVQKKTLDDPYTIVNTGKQFILLSKIYGILQIHKLDESFNISESKQIAVTQIDNDIQPVISVVDNGKLILTERIKTGEIQQNRIDATIITIDLNDLSYTTQSFNPYPDAYESVNSIIPVPYAGFDYRRIYLEYAPVVQDIPNSTYSLLEANVKYTDTTEDTHHTQLIKTDSISGEVLWRIPIDSSNFFDYTLSIYSNFATTYNEQVFLFYSNFIQTDSFNLYNNYIKKINENGQHQWTSTITDSIYIDSILYTSSSYLDYHNTLAYDNKAIISKYYTGRRNDSSFVKYIYFLLSLEDGSTEPLTLPDNQNPYIANTNYPYLVSTYSYTYKFFNNEAGELFIVYNNYNGCIENSDLDVSIEKYGQLISKLPANNIAERMDFTIFPNPARATIHVRLTNAEDFNKSYYTILDMTGRVLRQGIVTENEFPIDTQTLSEGNYLLHISQGDSTGTQKFQIIR